MTLMSSCPTILSQVLAESVVCIWITNCKCAMQISEIKMVDIPDVDLSHLGVTTYGKFSVEVVDPVSDYLELMEVRLG